MNSITSEINIFADLKRVADQTHLLLRFQHDFNDVEPIGNILVVEQAKPFLGCPNDAGLLSEGNSLMGIAKQICRPGFDFNKYQDFRLPISADQVDLAP
jgi:hypothetical protein